ncbi:MAG: ABC transporter ATP-binding protein [Candidatus Thermoplasmatota archaeon]|nr:ABC transporter ATP-binding protein [Candidatus Thermoplasmatota archaeon]
MIETTGLVKDYKTVRALDEISLKVGRGEIFGFFGPNGAGKTTAIKVLCGLTSATQGDASVMGIDVIKRPVHVRDNIAILSEEPRFYEEMSPRRYLNMFGKFMLMSRTERTAAINRAADLADLRGYIDRKIGQLSMGQRQRVSLARVLMSDVPLIFLDEPFEGVDILHRRKLREHFRQYVEKGNTVFFTSHNLIEAEQIVDRFAFIHKGKLIAVGTAEELKEKYLAPSYLLHVADPQKAKELLDSNLRLQSIQISEGNVSVVLQRRSDAPMVAKILVEGGVDLYEMKTTGTMEEVFERTSRGDYQ